MTAEPPACVSKKWPPRYRSTSSMSCAAVSGEITIRIRLATTRFSHTSIGIRPSVMPGQRMQRIVVTMLAAVPMLPMPLTSRPMIQ